MRRCPRATVTPIAHGALASRQMAFFRQPATGGLLGDAATNDDAAWDELLSLGTFPQVYVKVRHAALGRAGPFAATHTFARGVCLRSPRSSAHLLSSRLIWTSSRVSPSCSRPMGHNGSCARATCADRPQPRPQGHAVALAAWPSHRSDVITI